MQHALIVVESYNDTNILDLMSKIPTEFSLQRNNNSDKNYRTTIFSFCLQA